MKNSSKWDSKIPCLCLFLFFLFHSMGNAQQLNPGDGVKISFYKITDPISGEYFVELDSSIQLPYIGNIQVKDKSFVSLKEDIIQKYSSLYNDPELSVQPILRINILGEVRLPGFYYVTGYDKLTDLIAKAGGETSDAALDDIYIVRKDEEIKLNGEDLLEKGNSLIDIGLQSGDKIYIPRKWWVSVRNTSVIISAAAVIVALVSILKK